jgi:uncharacterized Zn finger protein (UPF0148 family)
MNKENVKKHCLDIYEKNIKTKFKLLRYDLNGPLLEHLKTEYGPNLKLSEYLYQGIHDKDISCPNGKNLKFKNIYDGYGFCGISCQCKKEHQAKVISEKWTTVSDEEKHKRNEKLKETNIKKYGVENPMQLDSTKKKIKQTNIEKYGVDHYSKTDEYKEKINQTSLEKYGVDYFSQSEIVKEKIKNTTVKNHGGMMVAARKASEEKFDGNVFGSDWFMDNRNKFYMDSFGAEHPLKSEKIKDTMIKNNIEKYGVSNPMQRHYNKKEKNIISDSKKFEYKLNEKGTYKLAKLLNCNVNTIYKYASSYDIFLPLRSASHQEENVCDFLGEHNIPFITNTRKILPSGKELDFYLPEYNLAIELNGLYWHSEISGKKDKNYHYNKWKECDELGVTLLSIQEDEFGDKTQFWFNKILYMTGKMKPTKIHARKCEVQELDNVSDFLNEHHLQGSCVSSYKFGLFYNNELVSVMTFSNTRNNDIGIGELSRFCNHSSYLVSGGASKLLSYFIKNYGDNYEKIISFSDNNYSNGNVYSTLGFELTQNLKPDYKYITPNYTSRHHKAGFRKSLIFKKFDIPDIMKNKSEWELMQYLGYDRIWDTGKKKWEMKI